MRNNENARPLSNTIAIVQVSGVILNFSFYHVAYNHWSSFIHSQRKVPLIQNSETINSAACLKNAKKQEALEVKICGDG